MRIHTGEKLYHCEYCDKAFNQKRNYDNHVRAVHTGEKPFSCELCEKAYSSSSSLSDHMRVHTGKRFNCDQCGNSFYTNQHLKRHQQKSCAVSKTKFKIENEQKCFQILYSWCYKICTSGFATTKLQWKLVISSTGIRTTLHMIYNATSNRLR